MALRPLLRRALLCSTLCSTLICGGLVCLPEPGRAESSSYTSAISEVDACNQAQYLMPPKAVVQRFLLRSIQQRNDVRFACTVEWSTTATAKPSGRPILFPSPVSIPLLGSGWL
jgi:hypothetical protein